MATTLLASTLIAAAEGEHAGRSLPMAPQAFGLVGVVVVFVLLLVLFFFRRAAGVSPDENHPFADGHGPAHRSADLPIESHGGHH